MAENERRVAKSLVFEALPSYLLRRNKSVIKSIIDKGVNSGSVFSRGIYDEYDLPDIDSADFSIASEYLKKHITISTGSSVKLRLYSTISSWAQILLHCILPQKPLLRTIALIVNSVILLFSVLTLSYSVYSSNVYLFLPSLLSLSQLSLWRVYFPKSGGMTIHPYLLMKLCCLFESYCCELLATELNFGIDCCELSSTELDRELEVTRGEVAVQRSHHRSAARVPLEMHHKFLVEHSLGEILFQLNIVKILSKNIISISTCATHTTVSLLANKLKDPSDEEKKLIPSLVRNIRKSYNTLGNQPEKQKYFRELFTSVLEKCTEVSVQALNLETSMWNKLGVSKTGEPQSKDGEITISRIDIDVQKIILGFVLHDKFSFHPTYVNENRQEIPTSSDSAGRNVNSEERAA